MLTFSVDIKELFYSLPQDELLLCVEQAIDVLGAVSFQNSSGVNVSRSLELLDIYLRSRVFFLQKCGICIGSCIAPVLSDVFLAKHDRDLEKSLRRTNVVKIYICRQFFFIIIDNANADFYTDAGNVLDIFKQHLTPLILAHEFPNQNS